MEGSPDGWLFRLRATDGEALRALQQDCHDWATPLTVERLDQSADWSESADDAYGLTAKQRTVLVAAIETGFFSLPRETTLADLAERFDISEQAVSEHLRRAQRNVLRETVLADESASLPSE
jgi:hypothetical protein